MSAFAKVNVGPERLKACRSCGQKLSVPWLPYMLVSVAASLLPFAGLLLGAWVGGAMPVAVLGLVIGAIPALWLHYRLVPLVARAPLAQSGDASSVTRP